MSYYAQRTHGDGTPQPNVRDLAYELLTEAQGLVRQGWCQGTCARDVEGRPVLPWDEHAVSWSAMGALMRARHTHEAGGERAVEGFHGAARVLDDVLDMGPQSWNDQPVRTSRDVVSAFDAAITDLLA